jgi:Protein of unknown function (DUF2934)
MIELESAQAEAPTTAPTEATLPEPAATITRPSGLDIGPSQREFLIRRAAYMLYERRGRIDGHADEDWLRAEALIDRVLLGQVSQELFSNRPGGSE